MKIFPRIKYFIKDIPFSSFKKIVRYVTVFLVFGFHPNSLKRMSLLEIRKDRFIRYLGSNIPISTFFLSNKKQPEKLKIRRIVFTINSFKGIGGTEVWLLQMVNELSSRGIHCLIFTSHIGEISTRLADKNVSVTSKISDAIRFSPDLIHLQHFSNKDISSLMLQINPKVPVFNLIHGVVPTLELPYINSERKIVYGAVSRLSAEKVKFLTKDDPREVYLIKNFFYQSEIPEFKTRSFSTCAVISSKISSRQMQQWSDLFISLGMNLDFYGNAPDKIIKDYKEIIEKYDFYLCTGKTAIDILGYGKPVILLEENLLGPAVVKDNIQFLSDMNFALANPLVNATELEDPHILHTLKDQIKKICSNDFKITNDYLLKENSIKSSADRLETIYSELIADSGVCLRICPQCG